MKCYATLLFCTLPFLTSEKTDFEMPITGIGSPSLLDVAALAEVMQGEARGEGEKGMIFVGDVLKNRAKKSRQSIAKESERGFYKSRSIKPKIWRLALITIQEPSLHRYTYFCNLKTAKNRSFVQWAKTRQGRTHGRHYFFSSKQKHDIRTTRNRDGESDTR